MLQGIQNLARRLLGPRARGLLRRGWYPIRLPYHQFISGESSDLSLCDGTRTLAQAARAANCSRRKLMVQEERGNLLLWPEALPPPVAPGSPVGIILSPHLDDAALSLGGHMLAQSGFLVLDVFSQVSWWRFELGPEQLPRIQATRDAEEEQVMRLARASRRQVGLPEAPLRGYAIAELFTAEVRADDSATREKVRAAALELARQFPGTPWFLPLAVGNHVDHRIARDVALEALRAAKVQPRDISFYEDQPYAAQLPELRDFGRFVPGCALTQSHDQEVIDLRGKLRLLRVYGSQLTVAQIEGVGHYARRLGRYSPRERLWKQT